MSKAVIWMLVFLGLLLLIIGAVLDRTPMWVIGLLMVAAGLYFGLRPGGILRKEQVWDNWGILIEDGQGMADRIFQDTKAFIEESKAPALKMEIKKIAPSVLRWGERREFLEVTDEDNPRLQPHQIFINARDYGNNLDVSWYLTFRLSFLEALLTLFFLGRRPTPTGGLDLFDLQDLRAYSTNVHHCLLKAVEKLMLELNQDPSKNDRKSKGFLGIS